MLQYSERDTYAHVGLIIYIFCHVGQATMLTNITIEGNTTVNQSNGGTSPTQTLSFAHIVSSEASEGFMLNDSPPPRVVGGKIAIMVDEEEYSQGVVEFRHSLIGRIIFSKWDKPVRNEDLKCRLSSI